MALSRTSLLGQVTGPDGTNFGTGDFTSSAFTPPDSSLLVVAGVFVQNSATTDPTSAFQISDSGGHTWTQAITEVVSPTSFPTCQKVWYTQIVTGASTTVTLTTAGRPAIGYAVSVVAYTGYDTVTPTGTTGHFNQASGFVSPTVVDLTLAAAPATTSEVFAAAGVDRSSAGCTPGAAWTEVHDVTNTAGCGLQTEIRTGSTSTNVHWDDIRPGGGAIFNVAAVAVEIRAAAAGGLTFPPSLTTRRRLPAVPRLPRTRVSTPVRAQVNPPFPIVEFHQARRLRGLLPRRGRSAQPVPAQVVVTPPAYPPQSVRTRLRGLRLFRSHTATPVPPQATVPLAAFVPPAVRGRLKLPVIRRHDIAPPIIDQVTPAQQPPRPRVKPRTSRGRAAVSPVAQAQAPLFTRIKLRMLRALRGKPRPVVPAQVVLIAPPYPPQPTRARRNQFAARRHRGGVDGWMVPGVHLCVTPRPNTGTTGRPGSGTTAYNTATTARPGTGTTTRPDSGITDSPC